MKIKIFILLFSLLAFSTCISAQNSKLILVDYNKITTGAAQTNKYVKLLTDSNVGVVANQSSTIGSVSLVDTLLSLGVKIKTIFSPEHGFRGSSDAGEKVLNNIDAKTNLPIISLYGNHKKPTKQDLQGIDVVVFDLQDVGTRFYTYISTLTYVMEACAENNVTLIVLDRPNPNAYFIDGPVLDEKFRSFVGLHPIPIVYGMTIGEYALMVLGEHWIDDAGKLTLKVIPMKRWTHNVIVRLKIKPSPNLPNWQSVYLYPSLCLFEGTKMSVGRGTPVPFQIFGSPDYPDSSFAFIPRSTVGAKNPKYNKQQCYGVDLQYYTKRINKNPQQLNLHWLINSYQLMADSSNFFNSYFVKLAGTAKLQKQIVEGLSENEIRKSWQPQILRFKKIRSKYLLYP